MPPITEDMRRRMQEEHRHLCGAQEDLVEHFEEFCISPDAAGLRTLSVLFEDFCASLLKHFEFEEVGGYMNTVMQRRPHHHTQVKSLLAEHAEIKGVIDRLRTDLGLDLLADGQALHAFKHHFVDLVRQVGRHEQAERELVMEVFWLEGGHGE